MESLRHYSSVWLEHITTTLVLGNSLRDYLVCLLILLGGYVLARVLHRQILRRLHAWAAHTEGTWDDVIVTLMRSNVLPCVYALIAYHALNDLRLQPSLARALQVAVTAVLAWQGVQIVITLINEALRGYWRRHTEDHSAAQEKSLNGIITLIKVVIWIIAAILAMDNLGIKVSAFMAGLGITGIAVALAAQAVLGDLFAYFVIFFDKPFEVGHTIKVGNTIGEVEHVGLKTTRLRSLGGEQVVLSNKHLTDVQVHNFKHLERRRIAFFFELESRTSDAALRALPNLVKGLFAGQTEASFERCHFLAITETGLKFEAVYFVETPDYARYMDIQQEINLGLKAEVERLGAAFAFPMRPIHVATEGAGKA